MQFDTGHLFHIFNQGNHRQKIFLKRENYIFFLQKIRIHVLPFADILAWCLMPNHFHLMVFVNHIEIEVSSEASPAVSPSATWSRARTNRFMSFNQSLGIMLASYTRAINKQQNWTGSLFRCETKAVCVTDVTGISPNWITGMGITQFIVHTPEKEYPNVCFNYILKNPVKDGLVKRAEDWEFSSYSDLIGIRNGKLINRSRIQEFGLDLSM